MKRQVLIYAAMLALLPVPALAQPAARTALQAAVDADARPIALYVTGAGVSAPFAVSRRPPSTPPLTADTPIRVSSNQDAYRRLTAIVQSAAGVSP